MKWKTFYNIMIGRVRAQLSLVMLLVGDLYCMAVRLVPNMLKNLPIIPSRTSQNFYPFSFFIPMVPPIIPFLFFCVSDNVTMLTWQIMFTDCFNSIFDCSIRVPRSFCKLGGWAQQTFRRVWALPGMHFGYTTA